MWVLARAGVRVRWLIPLRYSCCDADIFDTRIRQTEKNRDTQALPWKADTTSLPTFEIPIMTIFLHQKINYTGNIFTTKKRQIASKVAFLPDWLHCRNCLRNSLFNKSFVLMSKSSTWNHKSFSIFMCSKLYLKSKAHKYNFTHQNICLSNNFQIFPIMKLSIYRMLKKVFQRSGLLTKSY